MGFKSLHAVIKSAFNILGWVGGSGEEEDEEKERKKEGK